MVEWSSRGGVERIQAFDVRGIHRRHIDAITDGMRGRKLRGHLLRDASGRGPLGAALERDDEVDRAHRVDVVSERRVKDTASSEAHDHELWLVVARSVV